ncbi:sensor histidine kinase [Arcobacter sp. FWKO B]|uniref:sensor histidine kinase n=1 Tax=Arcobacter sp. FWKO B TaxID=2593672 RepID=UPI0018A68FF5|nr:HAMP domain-containing sensor histidine kinase [Arcobacter sp. FWKO B]QOG13082.1 HAMP domain-containing histidine kinase [Arcobacter sp. FWKO B]
MQIQQSTTSKQLFALIAVFLIGLILIVGVNIFFSYLMSELNEKVDNQKAKIEISEAISLDIQKLRSYFFEMAATTSNPRATKLVEDDIAIIVDMMNESIDVLERGGILKREVSLNIVDLDQMYKNIKYTKIESEKIVLEVLDIRPKIDEFLDLKQKLVELVTLRHNASKLGDTQEFARIIDEIRLFFKMAPAFFNRFAENNARLLYEAQKELELLEIEIEDKKNNYILTEAFLIFLIFIFVFVLGTLIFKSIDNVNKELKLLNKELNKNIKELAEQKSYVRGILDAQSNIVIVTSGLRIIDANKALFEFFSEYKTLEEFLSEHDCVCDFFLPYGEKYIIKKDYDGKNWAEYIYENSEQEHFSAIKRADKIYHFKINIDKQSFSNKEDILVVSLNDITIEIEVQNRLQELNENLENIVKEKTKELQDLNENLKQKVIIEVEKNRKKDKQMIEQSRHAALGEMIGNIAHQWRQPLSAISTTSSSVKLQMQLGIVSNEEVEQAFDDIMNYVQFLNQTIEDFRGFFRQDVKKEPFNILDSLKSTLKIVSASFKDNEIKIFTDYQNETIMAYGCGSELSQVLLNILNNAKDILVEKNEDDKKIHIYVEVVNDEIFIYIQDSGGGVPEEIQGKIFDPYFTTKHKSQGTGIGLYMSKEIVEKKLGGFLSVKNRDITLSNEHFLGACFIIQIPLFKE